MLHLIALCNTLTSDRSSSEDREHAQLSEQIDILARAQATRFVG